jgi:hypothetical protein
MSEDEALSETFRLADVAFRQFAAMTAANEGTTFEQAYTATWQLFERGDLKLVGEGDCLSVRVCIIRAERSTAAKQNRPLAAYWRRRARWIQRDLIGDGGDNGASAGVVFAGSSGGTERDSKTG